MAKLTGDQMFKIAQKETKKIFEEAGIPIRNTEELTKLKVLLERTVGQLKFVIRECDLDNESWCPSIQEDIEEVENFLNLQE